MKTAIKLCVFLALGTVPTHAQKLTVSAYFDGTCSGWTVRDDVIQYAVWDRYVTNPESVNDPIPADAVFPLYREHEPYCPTTEYRIRWFVVEDALSGKKFDARCVPAH